MALSDDQKAMLRLLAQREQGYDDLAALMGLSVEEVRAKVKDALAQLEEEGEPAPPIPVEPAPAPESAEPEPAAEEPIAAAPSEPEPPAAAPPPTPKPAMAPGSSTPPQSPRVSLPRSGGARAALAAGAVILVALVIVLVVSGGDDSGKTESSGEATTASEETISASSNPKLTQAVLDPVDGGDAKGVATFGRVKKSLALQVEAEGLAPSGNGQSYTVWLYEAPRKRVPLASTAVGANGKIGAQVQVPTEVLAYLANETFDQLDISLTDDATLKAALVKAAKEKKTPIYFGTDVLRGTIEGPIVGAAKEAGK